MGRSTHSTHPVTSLSSSCCRLGAGHREEGFGARTHDPNSGDRRQRHASTVWCVRPQPLISSTDVEASSRWYQQLLGASSEHGGPNYERLTIGGQLILQLHHFDVEHDHGKIGDIDDRPYGNGVLLWFETDDFDAAVQRATDMGVEVVLPPHRNPPTGEPGGPAHREIWLRDLDGYQVVLSSPDGEAPL
jgi:catechol 2,3-dioxygenase-like lactoylglutathione lyase family enzyme